jgi:hypothetical protein
MDGLTWQQSFIDFKPKIELSSPSHPDNIRDALLKFYEDKLKELTGFDYQKARQVYSELNNTPGIYPDVALIFYELLKQYKPKKIAEFGSGFSTLVFSHLINQLNLNTKLFSYEQDAKYLDITNSLLSRHNLNHAQVSLQRMFPDENLVKDADFVFLDWQHRAFLLIERSDWFKNVDILIMDDSQSPTYTNRLLYEFMNKSDRHCFMMLNAAGRTDMTEFISYKEELEPNVAYYLNHVMGYL